MSDLLLSFQNLRLKIGSQYLLDGIDGLVHEGDRICVVGRNGSGKSTLLKILAGEVDVDNGTVSRRAKTTIHYMPQEPVLPNDVTVLDLVAGASHEPLDPAELRAKAEQVLAELGMTPDRPADRLSGGEARRVTLARTFVQPADLILLDEPTNHLDLPSIEWLEARLQAYRGAFIVISHDRRFLSRLTRKTWWLDRGSLHATNRGFDSFEDWSQEILDAEAAETARMDKKLKAEMRWLQRGVTARRKRNVGRLRALHQLRADRKQRVDTQGSVQFSKLETSAGGSLVIEAVDVSKSHGARLIVDRFSTRIMRRDRVGIIGRNGAGKTTLLKLLIGEEQPDNGSIRHGSNLDIGLYDQMRQTLDESATPWQTLCPAGGDMVSVNGRPTHVVSYLKDFLFLEEQARQPIRALSGGERNRLVLARIFAQPTNLLVLDEPTNDLDMDTLDLLEELLSDYAGTILLVSHDRDFLDRLVTSTIVAQADGVWREYPGGYSDWLAQREQAPDWEIQEGLKPQPTKQRSPGSGNVDRQERKTLAKLQRELERLPAHIDAVSDTIRATESKLAAPDLFSRSPQEFERLSAELARLQDELKTLEDRWLELEEHLESQRSQVRD